MRGPNPKLNLVTPPANTPVSVSDVKQYLRLETSADDNLIPLFIQSATDLAETYAWRSFCNRTYELVIDCFPTTGFNALAVWSAINHLPFISDRTYAVRMSATAIELPNPPLASVTSIQYLDTTDSWVTLDPSQYIVSTDTPGQIMAAYGSFFPLTLAARMSSVKITYVAGYSDDNSLVPSAAQTAVMMGAAHLYNRRDAVTEGNMSNLPLGFYDLLATVKWGGYN